MDILNENRSLAVKHTTSLLALLDASEHAIAQNTYSHIRIEVTGFSFVSIMINFWQNLKD